MRNGDETKLQGYILHGDKTPRHTVSAPTWNMEMFRGLSVSWSERAAVGPVRERGVPAAGRLIASNEKNGENKMREGRAIKKTKQA